MSDLREHLFIYLSLARARKQELKVPDHDRLMVLSAVAACELGLHEVSQYCRQMVLKNNPGHMIGRYPIVDDAIADQDFQYFLRQIRRRFTIEYAEVELEKLNINYQQALIEAGSVERYFGQLFGVDYSWIIEHYDH